jgi:hypothetical protein
MGTPDQVLSTMFRCWEVEPTSESLVKYIEKFPFVPDKIIEKQGCVVPDEFLRTGRRARRADDKDDPLRGSQRKNYMVVRPLHPDCIAAMGTIVNGEGGEEEVNALADEADNVEEAGLEDNEHPEDDEEQIFGADNAQDDELDDPAVDGIDRLVA